MSQSYTDFSEYPTGDFPNGADWIGVEDAGELKITSNGFEGGQALDTISSSRSVVYWGSKSAADVEVFWRAFGEFNFSSAACLPMLRLTEVDPETSSFSAYTAIYDEGTGDLVVGIYGFDIGSWTTTSYLAWSAKTLDTSDGLQFRFRAHGNELSAKVWEVGESEPGAWDVQTTDDDLTSGKTGYFFENDNHTLDVFGVGTGGVQAPMLPVGKTVDLSWSLSPDDPSV